MRRPLQCVLLIGLAAAPLHGQIFDADFNEVTPGLVLTQPITAPTPLKRPTNIVLDFPNGGDTIEIVSAAGDLTDQPLRLDARTGGLSWGAFLNPTVHAAGEFSVSWDSLVLGLPVNDGPDSFQGVLMVTRTGDPGMPSTLTVHERWQLRYTPENTFEISDAFGMRTAGAFAVGDADQFDLDFDLDSGRWELAVNGSELLDGFLLTPFEFGGTIFLTNGRQGTADPPALVMDNLLVEAIEPMSEPGGDYNASGTVEQADLDLVLLNWGNQTPPIPTGWTMDLPNGTVDQEELDRVLLNWGATIQSSNVTSIPEPSAVVLAYILVAAFMAGIAFRPMSRHCCGARIAKAYPSLRSV